MYMTINIINKATMWNCDWYLVISRIIKKNGEIICLGGGA